MKNNEWHVLAIVVLFSVLITPVTAQTLNKGPISDEFLGITSMKLSDTKVTYGANITLAITWDHYKAEDKGTRYIAIIDWTIYTTKVKIGSSFSVANASDPENYKWFIALPEEGGSQSYNISTLDAKLLPRYYVVVVFNSSGFYNDSLCFVVESITGKPMLSVSFTPTTAALGDRVKIKYEMVAPSSEPYAVSLQMVGWADANGAPMVFYADCMNNSWSLSPKIYITPYFNEEWKGPYGNWSGCPQYFTLNSTYRFTNVTTGYIAATFVAGKNATTLLTIPDPTKTSTAAALVVEAPKISSLTVPSQHINGTDFVVSGSVNVAATNSEFDAGKPNTIELYIMDMDDNVKFNTSGLIGRDGTFRIALSSFGRNPYHPGLTLPSGHYKAKFVLTTDSGFTDEKTTVFELVTGQVKIFADKTAVSRGDTIKFTIRTNLKTANPVWFTIEDTRIMTNPPAYQPILLRVDAVGCAYYQLNVSPTAPITQYRFKAEIEGNVTDTIVISVVEHTFELESDKTTVARGGEIRFTGKTSADVVYVFASEAGIFKDVGDIPTEAKFITTPGMKKVFPDTDGNLNFKLEVLKNASIGTYELYFYAPTNTSEIDRTGDSQMVFSIEITNPRIVSVDIPSVIPYQGKVEVTITADPGKRENAKLTWVLEGTNIKARPTDFGGVSLYSLDSNNQVKFYLDLKTYKNGTKVIDPGLYTFTVKLYLDSEEVEEVQKFLEVSAITLDLTIEPEIIVIGDQIKVTIQTNREGITGYDHIWVTMVGTNYKAVRKVILDEKGVGVVKFNTSGVSEGTYKLYVRDTMNTSTANYSEQRVAEELYDLDPADATARLAKAHDDILVIRTIQILKEKPTPPTTPPVTTPAVTPTTPPPTTPPVTTPAVTPTTPPPTTPPAPGPIPGFEAIFAIAGLLAVAYLLRKKN